MKIYEIIRSYYDYADVHEFTVGRFREKDLAEYLADEFSKKFGNEMLSYFVREVELFENKLENWEEIYKMLEKEAE
jgi:ubiquinone biosynthesis protein UbiJ